MFEKVNPMHPDKIADRIAGALVDMAYDMEKDPKIAVEVLIGHGACHIIAESSVEIPEDDVFAAVKRISKCKDIALDYVLVPQDIHLAKNQEYQFRCGDNGIFKGMPVTEEQKELTRMVKRMYRFFPYDGKCILSEKDDRFIICQSNLDNVFCSLERSAEVNPIGDWTGGIDVDTGATNRKLGSDMGDSVTGGGLHGKDLSKADVSLNICAWLDAQERNAPVEYLCAIGDTEVNGFSYSYFVSRAREYINSIGGFEKFAEWGLIR